MTRYGMNITEYINSTDAEERYDFESHVFENVWQRFVKHLPTEQDFANDYAYNSIDVWYYGDNDEILCRSEELANMIADIINDISGEHEASVGWYDPEQDEKDDCVDDRTGWFVVSKED